VAARAAPGGEAHDGRRRLEPETVLRWARTEVGAWPEDLSGLDVTAGFSRIVAAASHPDLPGIASDPAVP
jgi:hypothetical protein